MSEEFEASIMAASDSFEQELWNTGKSLVAGCDESGCGALAGNVVMGVVIFPINIDYKKLLPGLNDSKQKTVEQRDILYTLIQQHALYYATAIASVEEIDRLNIYWAKFLAARRALAKLPVQPDFVLMDGDKVIPEITIPQTAIVKGDGKSISIAAASILAKVERDRHIDALADFVHPDFDWKSNKSYWSPGHVAALKKYGKTVYHREKYVQTTLAKAK